MKRNTKKRLDEHRNKNTKRLKGEDRAEQYSSKANHIFEPLIISIIVRTKNRPHLLSRCLQSLDNQLRQPDEVVVVNDAGVSIERVVSGFPNLNIHLIHFEESQGRARAGNLGVEAAQGNVIGFLDDDDQFLPDHLQRLEQAMLQFDARIAYSGCRVIRRDLMGESATVRETEVLEYNDSFDALRLRYENYIPLINILLEKSVMSLYS
jgi:glycosyltransferase involved in cell wall biosynthesis